MTTTTSARLCRCGCLESVTGRTARYVPGHDARHARDVAALLPGLSPSQQQAALAELVTPALMAQAESIAGTAAAHRARISAVCTRCWLEHPAGDCAQRYGGVSQFATREVSGYF